MQNISRPGHKDLARNTTIILILHEISVWLGSEMSIELEFSVAIVFETDVSVILQ